MQHVVSFSGGKDSTALLLMMLERGMPVDYIVFCDTGMEFPEVYEHIKKVEAFIGRKVTVLTGKHSFEYYLGEHVKANGNVGYGWPDFRNRWCTTRLKRDPFNVFVNQLNGHCVEYLGIAFDERERVGNADASRDIKYPLVDWKVTERTALKYCYDKGFDWGGLYKKFKRASCWCCPLSSLKELRVLYSKYPELWKKLMAMDKKSFRRFRADRTLDQLDKRFGISSRISARVKEAMNVKS